MKKLIYVACLGGLLLSACAKDKEIGEITMGEDHLSVPQGKSPADNRIADFYEKYGTSILYEFTPAEMNWSFVGEYNPMAYEVVPADPQDAGEMLDLLDELWFSFFPDEFLKEYLPYRIFLTDSCTNVVTSGTLTRRTFNYSRHQNTAMVVTLCSENSLSQLTPAVKLAYKRNLQVNLWAQEYANTLEFPDAYFNVSTWETATNNTVSSPDYFKRRGFWYRLNASLLFPEFDALYFFQEVMNRDMATIQTDLDTYPLLNEKFQIMRQWLIDEYDVDIVQIINKNYE